ncbi:unnamed protein product [Gongylonema pulchrum]|uniref:beta-mannosidase n=1 Tax=Gongylonema pulchrum TaxID=637853 RepID=A0A183D622_9BILA|nr:unnamed protein product [Gongylonema pulchrum]
MRGSARVPGDIYRDLFAGSYIPRPLFGKNDELLRWVPRTDWIYLTTFNIPAHWNKVPMFSVNCKLMKVKAVLLNAQGLDTVADVYFNNLLVLQARNQFVPYLLALKCWKIGENTLRIEFKSPVLYAEQQANNYQKQYGHIVPPFCPVPEFQGECHVNFMRKIQASFSWDWGPSFPTVGIWQPISIEGVETLHVGRISAEISFQSNFSEFIKTFLTDIRIRPFTEFGIVWAVTQ